MTLRRLGFVLGFVFLLFPAATRADGHRAGASFEISKLDGSSLLGFHTTGEVVFADISKAGWQKYVTGIVDYSWHKGDHAGVDDVVIHSSLGGVGFRFARSDQSPFVGGVHVLTGGVSGDGGNGTLAVGALLDWVPKRTHIGKQGAVRVQYDYLNRKGEQNFHRISVGGVIRFKTK